MRGETTTRSALDPAVLIAEVRVVALDRLREATDLWLILDGADLRKPHARQMPVRWRPAPGAPEEHWEQSCWLVEASLRATTQEPWWLLTDHPVETEAEAITIFRMYAQRWAIEDTFKLVKDALGQESVQVLTRSACSMRWPGWPRPIWTSWASAWATRRSASCDDWAAGRIAGTGRLDAPSCCEDCNASSTCS
ncbi:MAG: transposase [Thermomicrobiales bacterium]